MTERPPRGHPKACQQGDPAIAVYLNPDLLVIETGEGEAVNLMTAIYITLLASFTVYAVDVIKKLKEMLTQPTPGAADIDKPDATPALPDPAEEAEAADPAQPEETGHSIR